MAIRFGSISIKIILFLCFLLIELISHSQVFPASIYKDHKGMASNRITQIAQLPDGEIWIATQEGLSRFNGINWATFSDTLQIPPGIGKVRMEVLRDSSVVIASFNTDGFMLSSYSNSNNTWNEIKLPEELQRSTGDYIMAKAIGENSRNLIMGTGNKVLTYSNDHWTSLELPMSTDDRLTSMVVYGDSLFAATNKQVFLLVDNTSRKLLDIPGIINITFDPASQRCYMLQEGALLYYDLSTSELGYVFEGRRMGNSNLGVHSSLIVHGEHIYYSLNSPLTQYNHHTKKHQQIVTEYYTSDHTCMSALVDHEGSIWVATLRGAFRIKDASIYNYNGEALIENEVTAIYEDSEENLYLGANIGLSVIWKDGTISHYPLSNSSTKNRIMDIVEFNDTIYLSAFPNGIMTFSGAEGLEKAHSSTSLENVSDLHVYNDELYCSSDQKIYKLGVDAWDLVYQINDSINCVIRKLYFNDEHRFVLTDVGLIDLSDSAFIKGHDLYQSNLYSAVYKDDKLLLGSATELVQLKDNEITASSYTIQAPIYTMNLTSDDDLWLGTGSGVISFADGKKYSYTKGNGLIGNEVNRNAFVFSSKGSLLVGTDEGMSVIDPTVRRVAPVPKVKITAIAGNQEPLNGYNLSHEVRNLKFTFQTISFYNIDELNYRVRLLGLNPEWEEISFAEQNSITYPNLSSGKYRFEVQSRISDGEWSKVARSPSITIDSPIHETIWFRMIIIVLFIVAFVVFYRIRNKVLKDRNEELENRVLEKTQELEQRNQELVFTIENLKAAQGQLIQSEKLASMGHLTSGIAHELNNPLNYIRGGAECIIKNLDELSELLVGKNGLTSTELKTIMDDSKLLAESILEGANKSTGIVKSLGSFTADSQNFYSFTDLQKEVETSLTLLNNEIGFRIIINKMFGNIPPIECYPAKINQMLVNILLNAIQAIKNRGEITVRYYRKDDQFIAIEISDDGEGVNSHLHEKVFEPFFTTKDSNPGLGLTIAKSIVQEHKGSINFISKPGLGTKVKILLPVSQTYHPELEGETV